MHFRARGGSFCSSSAVSRRPAFSKVERSLEQQALLWSFYIEREYLAELLEAGEVDSTDLYDLYNEVALAEAMVLDPKNSFHHCCQNWRKLVSEFWSRRS